MIRTGDVLTNPATGERLGFLKAAADTNGEYVLVEVEVEVEPNGFVAAAHVHPYQAETFEILEGTLYFRLGRDDPGGRRRSGDRRARHRPQVLERR